MGFLSDGIWWLLTALSLVFTVIYVRTTMTTGRDLLIALIATGFVVASFIFIGWVGGVSALLVSWLLGGFFAAVFHGRKIPGESPIGSPPQPLRRIVRDIQKADNRKLNLDNIHKDAEERQAKYSLFFEYCEQQPETGTIIRDFNVSRDTLKKLFDELIAVGAGQWMSGHYVAASALAYPISLQYLLNNWELEPEDARLSGRRPDDSPLKQEIAFKLLMYFRQGDALE